MKNWVIGLFLFIVSSPAFAARYFPYPLGLRIEDLSHKIKIVLIDLNSLDNTIDVLIGFHRTSHKAQKNSLSLSNQLKALSFVAVTPGDTGLSIAIPVSSRFEDFLKIFEIIHNFDSKVPLVSSTALLAPLFSVFNEMVTEQRRLQIFSPEMKSAQIQATVSQPARSNEEDGSSVSFSLMPVKRTRDLDDQPDDSSLAKRQRGEILPRSILSLFKVAEDRLNAFSFASVRDLANLQRVHSGFIDPINIVVLQRTGVQSNVPRALLSGPAGGPIKTYFHEQNYWEAVGIFTRSTGNYSLWTPDFPPSKNWMSTSFHDQYHGKDHKRWLDLATKVQPLSAHYFFIRATFRHMIGYPTTQNQWLERALDQYQRESGLGCWKATEALAFCRVTQFLPFERNTPHFDFNQEMQQGLNLIEAAKNQNPKGILENPHLARKKIEIEIGRLLGRLPWTFDQLVLVAPSNRVSGNEILDISFETFQLNLNDNEQQILNIIKLTIEKVKANPSISPRAVFRVLEIFIQFLTYLKARDNFTLINQHWETATELFNLTEDLIKKEGSSTQGLRYAARASSFELVVSEKRVQFYKNFHNTFVAPDSTGERFLGMIHHVTEVLNRHKFNKKSSDTSISTRIFDEELVFNLVADLLHPDFEREANIHSVEFSELKRLFKQKMSSKKRMHAFEFYRRSNPPHHEVILNELVL